MTAIPDGVKAAILRAVAASKYPLQSLPSLASRHELTLAQVKDMVEHHGWPRPESMRKAAAILEARFADQVMADQLRAETTTDDDVLVEVPIGRLHPDPNNPREDLGDLTELAGSLAEAGLVQPVIVRRVGDRLVIVAGHRRASAARTLGWETVKCVIRSSAALTPDEVLVQMLAENGQRQPLDPIDEARALALLKERDDLTDAELGRKISRSQPYISNRLALLSLTATQQAQVRAGLVTLDAGTQAGRKQGGTHRPAAQGKKSAAHLTHHHPLADLVAQTCVERKHSKNTPGRVGDVACGRCWEDVIRGDERRLVQTTTTAS